MGGLSDLGINLPALIAQLVNFTILLGLLYLFAYKPIMRMLDERSRKIKEGMEQAEAVKEKAKIFPGAFQPLTNRGRRIMLMSAWREPNRRWL